MDERDFIDASAGDFRTQEEENLYDNLVLIDQTINSLEEKKKRTEEDRDDCRGDYQMHEEFIRNRDLVTKLHNQLSELKETAESPYHLHLHLSEKENDEDLFIGLNDVVDEKGTRIVYSVWSEVAKAFSNPRTRTYTSLNGYRYNLEMKRNISIEHRKMIDCVEEFNSQSGHNEDVTDYMLRNILRQKKNVKGFTDIVKTIQEKQNTIIRDELNKNIMCQGVAGSGKTAIIVHRLSNLLYNNPNIDAERYLFIAPNDNFKHELSALNKKLKIDKVKYNTLYEYYIDKLDYYLENTFGKNSNNINVRDYLLKGIVDDDSSNIAEMYSKEYLENKYKTIIDSVIEDISSVLRKYNYEYDFDLTIRENYNRIREFIDEPVNAFNKNRTLILKAFDSINDLKDARKIGQKASDDPLDDFNKEKNDYYIDLVNKRIKDYELLIQNAELVLTNYREKIDYDFYKEYSFSENNIKDKIKELVSKKELLDEETSKLEKSLFGSFQKSTIENNKIVIEELNEEINNLENKISELNSEEFEYAFDKYNEAVEYLKKYYLAKKNLNETKNIFDNTLESIEAFRKLKICFVKSDDDFISYKRILRNLINKIIDTPENIDTNFIIELNNLLLDTKRINEQMDYDIYLNSKNDLDLVYNSITKKALINKCFKILLDNKYKPTSDAIKKSIFSRNEIVTLLYVLDRLGFAKNRKYDYIFIDEAQDYNDQEICLVKEMENNPILNIFGDYQQNISNNSVTRTSWNGLLNDLNTNFEVYELLQNYRNTTNVVEYCNKVLNTNMTKIGVDGNEVIVKDYASIKELIDMMPSSDTQIITNNISIIEKVKSINSNIKINTVLNVKGLEFENVIVIEDGLDFNNKYVAYTRTKNDLIIVKNIVDEDIKPSVVEEKIDNIEDVVEELMKLSGRGIIDYELLDIYYNENNVLLSDKRKIENRLLIKGIRFINNSLYTNLEFDQKVKRIMGIFDDVKEMTDSEFINILKSFSNDPNEQDELYEAVIDNGATILED